MGGLLCSLKSSHGESPSLAQNDRGMSKVDLSKITNAQPSMSLQSNYYFLEAILAGEDCSAIFSVSECFAMLCPRLLVHLGELFFLMP